MENYVVINGVRYVLAELPFKQLSHCYLCAFNKQCKEMVEYPFCEVFGFVEDNKNFIFVKVL